MRTILIGTLLITSGCATVVKTTLLGAGVGAAAGTGVGLISQKSVGSALIGAGIGGIVGSALFYLGARDKAEKDALSRAALKNKKGSDEEVPLLTVPDVVCHYIEAKLEDGGTKWVGPHQVCEVKKPSVFTK